MLFWIIWIIVTVAVLVSKFYTVKEVSKLNRMLNEEEKHLSAAKVEAKVSRSSLEVTCLGIVDTPRSSIFYRYRRCVYEWSRNFTSEKAV